MAKGDITLFHYHSKGLQLAEHDMLNDDIRMTFIDTTKVAAATDESPVLTDYTEITGDDTPSGGKALQNKTLIETGGVTPFDADPLTFPQDASVSTALAQGIIYNNSREDKRCIAFMDADSHDLTAAPFTATWAANGVYDLDAS